MNAVESIRKSPKLLILTLLYVFVCISCAFVLSRFPIDGSFILLSMSVTVLILFVMPLVGVNTIDSLIRRNELLQFLSEGGNYRIAVLLTRYPLIIAAIVCLIPALSGLLLRGTGSVSAIIAARTFILTLAIALFALAIGFYAATVCRNALSGAGLALLIVALICTEPIWFGPVINLVPDSSLLIQSSLTANPFIDLASALGFDILRTDPFYEICPIGQMRFHYPPYWSAILFHLGFALLFFLRSIAGIRRIIAPSV